MVEEIRADFDRLLAGCERHYRALEAALAQTQGPASDELRDAMRRATELIEVLESVAYDRMSRLVTP
jgi:predicted methyltransferase